MAGCAFVGCAHDAHAKGLCASHRRQQAAGEELRPLRYLGIGRPFTERFWVKVRKTDSCWDWTGSTNQLGYGQIWDPRTERLVFAHRISLQLAGRPVPEHLVVDHLCRRPGCVNPEHLEIVTQAVNLERADGGAPQMQAAKTHCPYGHPYTDDNTYLRRNSAGTMSRECRTCRAARRLKATA